MLDCTPAAESRERTASRSMPPSRTTVKRWWARVAPARRHERRLHAGHVREQLTVGGVDLRALRVLVVEPRQAADGERRARLVDPVVAAERDDVVAGRVTLMPLPGERGHPVRSQQLQALCRLVVAAHDHAALADREILVREEAVGAREPERAGMLVADARAERVRCVLEQHESVLGCQRAQALRSHPGGRRTACSRWPWCGGVMRFATSSGSSHGSVRPTTSAKTGVAPV